jgi:glucose/arabinose dehydrogenase
MASLPPRSIARRFGVPFLGLALLVATGCASGASDPATDVTDKAATLRAHGSAGGDPTQYWFQYGTSTSYGTSTPRRDGGAGTDQRNVSERITGLTPDTLYHFRACASNAKGAGCSSDRTFRTGSLGLLPGFQETTAFTGLDQPTVVRFAADGHVFVAEKRGVIKEFDSLSDTTPQAIADFRTKVHNFWDRGLLGMALDPDFPAEPYIYVAYTYDAVLGGTAPRWGTADQNGDACPDPPGATIDGCEVSGRLSRLRYEGGQVGPEQVLIEDWCQQYPSHSVGDIEFGADGALYMSGGDGASFNFVDYGQVKNPCGDPPGAVGTNLSAPSAEGGALRSQDVRTPGDPTSLNGTVIRVDRETGEGLPGNPLADQADPDARRIIAQGLRNPFRMAFLPGTNLLWVGDVGWNDWEEINLASAPNSAVANFGWPCYEGSGRQPGYDAADLTMCESLYSGNSAKAPFFKYQHSAKVRPEETCPPGSSSIAGLAFTPPNSTLPAEFDGAVFFTDHTRGCIWVMERGASPIPNPSNIRVFRDRVSPHAVDLQFGPDNDLYFPDHGGGTIRRIHYTEGNQVPRAQVSASPTNGAVPLNVSFSASASSDPDPGDTLSYAWDLDGDDQFDDGDDSTAAFTYAAAGSHLATLKVTDNHGASATDSVAIEAGNTPPVATITAPTTGLTWKVGDTISFAGSAIDDQDGTLGASRLSWTLALAHCPSNCHEHIVQTFSGSSGSFPGPDHEFPSYLELRLTATDSGGLEDTRAIRLDPKTVVLKLRSNPSGLQLSLNGAGTATPFDRTAIQGSTNAVAAPTPQTLSPFTYDFASWSDGLARIHDIVANADRTLTATFTRR